jgi:hypothetical protein
MRAGVAGRWLFLALVSWPGSGFAQSRDEVVGRAKIAIADAEAGLVAIAATRHGRRPATPEERLAEGDMFLRNKDFARAIQSFNQVVELFRQGRANKNSHAEGLFLLGEAYFLNEQLLSAQRAYRELAQLAVQEPYSQYAGRALGRLVDVALRTDHHEVLDFVFAQISHIKQDDAAGSLAYARAKAHFARRSYPESQRALEAMPTKSYLSHQAGYLLGVVLLNRALGGEAPSADETSKVPEHSARFARPILQFQKVTQLPTSNPDQQHVVALAWMAIGRIFYESGSELDAVDAYNHVDRGSPEFATMLYELSWVYVRLGDFKRAQRALELLSVLSPETLHFADGSLLRADLMLRSKDYEGALRVYQSVKGRFAPILSDVSHVLTTTRDPAVYYDQLVQERLGVRTEHDLPPVVMDWVREESEDDRVFALIDDVTRGRDLVRDSQRMVKQMGSVLGSSTRAKAFPDLKLKLQVALGFLNELAFAKRDLLKGLAEAEGDKDTVPSEAELMERLSHLPVTVGDFARREASGQEQWNKLSQKLQQLRLEADKLQAVVNGLKRVLRESERYGVIQLPAARERFQAEVEANERDLEGYRKHVDEYREAVERGRVQIGFGDSRYQGDRVARSELGSLISQRFQDAANGKTGADARAFAAEAAPVLARAERIESRLKQVMDGYETEVAERSAKLSASIQVEAQLIREYADRLDALDQNARLLVGEVAMRNFGLVRERLKSIVLRADVGVVQQAWEVREHSREKLQELQRQRAKEEEALNEELQEVLQDGEEDQ